VEITARQRQQSTRNITLWGVAVNILLSIIKTIGGIAGQSAALLADGLHSMSDLVSDGMVLVAARHASHDADEDHPYGHARFETITTVALGALLLLVGAGIAYDAVVRLVSEQRPAIPHFYTLYIAAVSIISKEVLYHLTRRVGIRIRSKMLEANAWHHRTDAVSSIIVLIGIAGALLGFPLLDAYAAVIVALMVMKIGVDLGYQSIMELVDTALDPDEVERIRQTILTVTDVRELHMLRTRRMGHNALVDVHIQVAPKLSVSEGHHISELVEHRLIKEFEDINDVTVHIDPENDETAATCAGLPLRKELMAELQAGWSDIPQLQAIEDVTLHYLNGGVIVEATLPLSSVPDIESATQLQTQFQHSCEQIKCIGSANLKFI
jgi:cation diffusion facilitator family transporter